MAILKSMVLSMVVVLVASKKATTADPVEVKNLKDLLLTSMQSIVSLNELVTDLADKMARYTTSMSETRAYVKQLKTSVVGALGELSSSFKATQEDVQQTKVVVGDLQKDGNLTAITEQIAQLEESLAETKAEFAGMNREVMVVGSEEGAGDAKCVKVCAGTTGRKTTDWANYHTQGLTLTVDISKCGYVKIPTITTSVEGRGYHWRATGTSAVYKTTTKGFTMYLEGGREPGHNPKGGKAEEWEWNVEWIAVGYTC